MSTDSNGSAGRLELAPETVDMDRLDTSKWYLESAKEADREFGAKGAAMVRDRMRTILSESRVAK